MHVMPWELSCLYLLSTAAQQNTVASMPYAYGDITVWKANLYPGLPFRYYGLNYQ